jgi:hypothetical protein
MFSERYQMFPHERRQMFPERCQMFPERCQMFPECVFLSHQHFRRHGQRFVTSPVFEPEKTRGARALKDLVDQKNIKFGSSSWPHCDAYAVVAAEFPNATYCSYFDRFTEEYVPCNGTENLSFHPIGLGIQEVQPRPSLSTPLTSLFF